MEESVPDTPSLRKDVDDAETVATVLIAPRTQQTPLSQRFTQPTQIIDRTPNEPKSVVQVAASSPAGPASSPLRPHGGGALANLMAPSGTQFRPPSNPHIQKRAPVLSDDEGPNYAGGSSDEDELTIATNIKPRILSKPPSKSPEKIMESPIANKESSGGFKDLTARFAYQPSNKRSSEHLQSFDRDSSKKLKQTTMN